MRLLVLSNVNMAPLQDEFCPEHSVAIGVFDNYLLDLIDSGSQAYQEEVQWVICHLDGDAAYCRFPDGPRDYLHALRQFLSRRPETIVMANTLFVCEPDAWSYSGLISESHRDWEFAANHELTNMVRDFQNFGLLDTRMLYQDYGRQGLHNSTYWYLGGIRYTNRMFSELAKHYQTLLAALRYRSKKVLVVDLDHTLWGGVVGEVGIDGIELAASGRGAIYRDLQRLIKQLRECGVLLAVNSKNNEKDAMEVFDKHPSMILKANDFVCLRINWQNKAENMQEIARELGLGLDSMVFLDDDPRERELVCELLPEVAVPAFSARKEDYPSWFVEQVVLPYFPRFRLTAEDRDKTPSYFRNRSRAEQSNVMDLQTFIDGLRIELSYHVDDLKLAERASQLTQKTNQFNLTGRSHSVAEIRDWMANDEFSVVLLGYQDRFGAEGIVGFSLLNRKGMSIDSLMLSCRVLGRGVEQRFVSELQAMLVKSGEGSTIQAVYIPTKKNLPVAAFFDRSDFWLNQQDADGRRFYVIQRLG